MLFDLQGKRRRLVQAVYLMLAVLMGGGLVLFGIGGDVSGGLFDAFSDRSNSGSDVVEERVEKNEERAAANPRAVNPHKELVRDYYSLAVAQASEQGFPADAQDDLRKASTHWTAYLDAEKDDPDASLARVALQVYDVSALNQPQEAVKVARIIAADGQGKDPNAYLQLVQYALLAGDKRVERLASAKVLDLVPKSQRKAARKQLQEIKGQVIARQLQQSGDIKVDPTQQGGGAQGGGTTQNQQNQGGQ